MGDITEPLSGKTFPLDERVKAALKTNARASVESFLTSLMPYLCKSPSSNLPPACRADCCTGNNTDKHC